MYFFLFLIFLTNIHLTRQKYIIKTYNTCLQKREESTTQNKISSFYFIMPEIFKKILKDKILGLSNPSIKSEGYVATHLSEGKKKEK